MFGSRKRLLDSGDIARASILTPVGVTGEWSPRLDLKGDPTLSEMVTLVLTANGIDANGNPSLVDNNMSGAARVTWGVGQGSPSQAIIDVGMGTVVHLSASSLQVEMRNESPVGAANANCQLGAMVCYNSPSGQPAQRVTRSIVNTVVAGATVNVAFPKFAKDVNVLRAVGVPFTLLFLGGGGITGGGLETVGALQTCPVIRLSGRTNSMVVTNNGAADQIFDCVFGLAL